MSPRPGLRALSCVVIFILIPYVVIFKLGCHRISDPDPETLLHTKGELEQGLSPSRPVALGIWLFSFCIKSTGDHFQYGCVLFLVFLWDPCTQDELDGQEQGKVVHKASF